MTKDSDAFLQEIHILIEQQSSRFADIISGKTKSQIPLLNLSDEEAQFIKKIFSTHKQTEILEKIMLAFGRELVFSLLCVIDGVSDTKNNLPNLSLVNRETKMEINHDFLHDEFIELLEG